MARASAHRCARKAADREKLTLAGANMKIYRIKRVREQNWRQAKIFRVKRSPGQAGEFRLLESEPDDPPCVVCTVEHGDISYELPDRGFEAGYGGRGPTDLAFSILADYFRIRVESNETLPHLMANVSNKNLQHAVERCLDFKNEFIAPLKLDTGQSSEITGEQIAA